MKTITAFVAGFLSCIVYMTVRLFFDTLNIKRRAEIIYATAARLEKEKNGRNQAT
jgi:hypothetical protein